MAVMGARSLLSIFVANLSLLWKMLTESTGLPFLRKVERPHLHYRRPPLKVSFLPLNLGCGCLPVKPTHGDMRYLPAMFSLSRTNSRITQWDVPWSPKLPTRGRATTFIAPREKNHIGGCYVKGVNIRMLEEKETETNPATRSPNFGDDLYQVDTPNSVGEDTKDMSHEGDSSQPSRALFSRILQAEAIQYELSKLLQSSSVYLDQPEDQSKNMSMLAVWQGSAREETLPPEIKPEALQTIITQLEAEVKVLSKLEQEHRPARNEQERLFFH